MGVGGEELGKEGVMSTEECKFLKWLQTDQKGNSTF